MQCELLIPRIFFDFDWQVRKTRQEKTGQEIEKFSISWHNLCEELSIKLRGISNSHLAKNAVDTISLSTQIFLTRVKRLKKCGMRRCGTSGTSNSHLNFKTRRNGPWHKNGLRRVSWHKCELGLNISEFWHHSATDRIHLWPVVTAGGHRVLNDPILSQIFKVLQFR